MKYLAQIKVDDTLSVKYFRSIALDFKKGDGMRMQTVVDTSDAARKGQMPGAAAYTRINTVSNIWALSPQQGMVLVRGPFDHFAEVHLTDPAMLSGVRAGDEM